MDPARKALDSLSSERVDTEQADGVTFLAHHLRQQDAPDWIIPALPVHLAAEWCLARSGPDRLRRISLPPETDLLLPNPMRGESGDVYVSHATFLCPDDCSEPRNICTITQQPRKQNMSDLLGEISLPGFDTLVIRSRQLGAGVGGYRPASLFRLLPGGTIRSEPHGGYGLPLSWRDNRNGTGRPARFLKHRRSFDSEKAETADASSPFQKSLIRLQYIKTRYL